MQDAVVTRFGAPEVLVTSEAPDPVAGGGQAAYFIVHSCAPGWHP
jgi:hypothetical protein